MNPFTKQVIFTKQTLKNVFLSCLITSFIITFLISISSLAIVLAYSSSIKNDKIIIIQGRQGTQGPSGLRGSAGDKGITGDLGINREEIADFKTTIEALEIWKDGLKSETQKILDDLKQNLKIELDGLEKFFEGQKKFNHRDKVKKKEGLGFDVPRRYSDYLESSGIN